MKFTVLFLSFLLFQSIVLSQNPEWINYTNGDHVYTLAEDSEYLWAGTNGGLVRIEKTSGETTFYNRVGCLFTRRDGLRHSSRIIQGTSVRGSHFWKCAASAFPAACRSRAEIPFLRGCGVSERITIIKRKLPYIWKLPCSLQGASIFVYGFSPP